MQVALLSGDIWCLHGRAIVAVLVGGGTRNGGHGRRYICTLRASPLLVRSNVRRCVTCGNPQLDGMVSAIDRRRTFPAGQSRVFFSVSNRERHANCGCNR